MILLGGPLHRRVYWSDDVPAPIPYRDSGRYSKVTLGAIHKLAPAELRDRVPRVWELVGEEVSTLRPPAPGARGFGHACTRRGCLEPATMRLAGPLERKPWYGCREHWPALQKAMSAGRSIEYSVDAAPC